MGVSSPAKAWCGFIQDVQRSTQSSNLISPVNNRRARAHLLGAHPTGGLMLLSALLLSGLGQAADPQSHTFPDAHRLWIQSIVGDVSVQGGGSTMEVTATTGQWDEGCNL